MRFPARFRRACLIACLVILVWKFILGGDFSSAPSTIESNAASILGWQSSEPEDRDPYIQFSRRLVRILKKTKPPVSALTKTDSIPATGFNDNKSKSLKRPDYVPITPAEVEGMRLAHQVMVREMSNLTLPFKQESRGIVSTAGGAHLPIFIVSLRMLRRSGSVLPVELFLRADEARGDNYLCQELLPSLNARCVILDDFFPSGLVKLEKYQYKIFSVLFSSFGEVLLLDADNFPVHNVDHVFKTEPFTTTGLVTWPDFWISSASEKFYKIQGKPVPSTNVRASTESGQVLVNKQTHSTALLVSTYYNFYGPSHYYPLLTQGGPGEGDKETFLAGAVAVDASFYQVSEPVKILGYDDNGELRGVAMLQSNPVDDYIALVKPLPFTIHANFPKMDPNTLFNLDGPAINHRTGEHRRLWGEKDKLIQTFGMDVERELWAEIRHVACTLGGVFVHWKADAPRDWKKGTCELVEEHIIKVFGVDDDSIYDPSAT
ncbi:nucleotide-diphospho-sugar transferase [Aureobasidium pullulans]|uniref:Nucleotide-diphospho-sugar transferase n=1 Tax=Aureobasidium pullulans TaxID=5580 RepID=A0A4S9I186_AURPU|nr:nucleotide-diphospho-sugar transferase [Aureobasidium pullulans]THX61298.1 nucleotide-diphospho-sugar transferase [Aureobasidium pullulans]THX81607.1 nucleotide-diphospho-sugar transferase [Aureobasidium pullulans]THY65868.1 nucleotide-diphospho-sugar transferase [Aureobasidium pullulans]THZ13827.1 nucleotide-diphospho-sugar transferase [Aureobasidium pullulans]